MLDKELAIARTLLDEVMGGDPLDKNTVSLLDLIRKLELDQQKLEKNAPDALTLLMDSDLEAIDDTCPSE